MGARAARALPASVAVHAPALSAAGSLSRGLTTVVNKQQNTRTASEILAKDSSAGLVAIQKRHAGVSVLGCAIAMVAVGGCAQGIGQLFRGAGRRHGAKSIYEGRSFY